MAKQRGLGRGLSALIRESQNLPEEESASAEDATPSTETSSDESPAGTATQVSKPSTTPTHISTAEIEENPWQPRQHFEDAPLDDLVNSIKQHGVLQPLIVRPHGDQFQLIAGERRLRASKAAGLAEVPVIVKTLTDREALEIALIENLQREDLNIIEEAEGYQALADQFELTQEQIAERVGKGRTTITNALRLLGLSTYCKAFIRSGDLTTGHAKALLGLDNAEAQDAFARRIAQEGLSVRAAEAEVSKASKKPKKQRTERPDVPDQYIEDLTLRLQQHLGTGTRIRSSKTLANGKKVNGKVEIDFYSSEDLDRLLTLFGLSEEL